MENTMNISRFPSIFRLMCLLFLTTPTALHAGGCGSANQHVTVHGDQDLSKLTRGVTSLTLTGGGINDELISNINARDIKKSLTQLTISHCPPLGEPLARLIKQFKALRYVNFSIVEISPEVYAELRKTRQLESISLSATSLDNGTLKDVLKCSRLKSLYLSQITLRAPISVETSGREDPSEDHPEPAGLTFEGIQSIKTLEKVSFYDVPLAPGSLENIRKCLRIKTLKISHTDVSNQDFTRLKSMRFLQLFELNQVVGLTPIKKTLVEDALSKTNIQLVIR